MNTDNSSDNSSESNASQQGQASAQTSQIGMQDAGGTVTGAEGLDVAKNTGEVRTAQNAQEVMQNRSRGGLVFGEARAQPKPTPKIKEEENPVVELVKVAESFLQWANNKALAEKAELAQAQTLLLDLFKLMTKIPYKDLPPNAPVPNGTRPDASYQAYFEQRFGSFPIRYYGYVLNPFANPPEEPLIGDTAEDLTIIYLDLYEGLSIYHSKRVNEAVWFWKETFLRTWGRNIIGVLSTIYNYELALHLG